MDGTTYTLDDTTGASNPGELRVSKWRWVWRYPKWPLRLFLAWVASAGLITLHWGFAIPGLLLGLANILYWKRVEEHFTNGDANPGIIVQTHPVLIAIRTDLTKGQGRYPVIKIIEERHSRRWSHRPEEGMRVATVALYQGGSDGEHSPHWTDFLPKPIEPIAKSKEDIERVMSSFSEHQWSELFDGLRRLRSFEPGLYPLYGWDSDWR